MLHSFRFRLTLLFVAGGFLLWKVDVEAGAEAARSMEDGAPDRT